MRLQEPTAKTEYEYRPYCRILRLRLTIALADISTTSTSTSTLPSSTFLLLLSPPSASAPTTTFLFFSFSLAHLFLNPSSQIIFFSLCLSSLQVLIATILKSLLYSCTGFKNTAGVNKVGFAAALEAEVEAVGAFRGALGVGIAKRIDVVDSVCLIYPSGTGLLEETVRLERTIISSSTTMPTSRNVSSGSSSNVYQIICCLLFSPTFFPFSFSRFHLPSGATTFSAILSTTPSITTTSPSSIMGGDSDVDINLKLFFKR